MIWWFLGSSGRVYCVHRLAEGVSARYRAKSQKGPREIYRGEGGHVANGPWRV